jgi:lipoprotein-anchoring transpeptidase ErfK/SrfK
MKRSTQAVIAGLVLLVIIALAGLAAVTRPEGMRAIRWLREIFTVGKDAPGAPPGKKDDPRQDASGNPGARKYIEIDLTRQRLLAYEDDRLLFNFPVSSGIEDKTPRGVFRLWKKHRIKDMEIESRVFNGVRIVPNVPFVMFFYNDREPRTKGLAIHGTYWHKNFGHPMSHGCINMSVEDAGKIFTWSRPSMRGAKVVQESEDNPGMNIVISGHPEL